LRVELGAAEGDDQREIVGEALLAQLHEQRKALDVVAIEAEAPFAPSVRQHDVERGDAELGTLLVDERRVEHLGAGLARPGDAHAVEQRMQDAEADIHAVDGDARGDEALHGGLDQRGERRVGEARGDDRGRDVGRVRQIGGVERVHAGAIYRGIAWGFCGGF
jgi:hypothetical protein